MRFLSFAFLAEIKIRTNTTFVSDSLDRTDFASIASNILMDLSSLISSLFGKILSHESLESLSSVTVDFFLKHLREFAVEFVLQHTSSIASSAWQSSPVDLGAIASEACDGFFVVNVFFFLIRSQDLAVDLLFLTLNEALNVLVFSLDEAITGCFFHILLNLNLTCKLLSIYCGIELLFVSLDEVSISCEIAKFNQVVHISGLFIGRISSTNCN